MGSFQRCTIENPKTGRRTGMVSASPILAPNHQYSKRDLRAWATHFPKAARRADERTGGEAAAEAGCSSGNPNGITAAAEKAAGGSAAADEDAGGSAAGGSAAGGSTAEAGGNAEDEASLTGVKDDMIANRCFWEDRREDIQGFCAG